jgi:MFS transporter, AAHS family, 4-hydroxybenzoate transporter
LEVGFVLAFMSLVVFINGSQTGTMTIATISYPPDIRNSGIGRTCGVAKIGAISAPAVGGTNFHVVEFTLSIPFLSIAVLSLQGDPRNTYLNRVVLNEKKL